MELESPDEGAALGDVPTQEQSVPSSSNTAKQSKKLAYWRMENQKLLVDMQSCHVITYYICVSLRV
jgi:hypothetical protein